MKHKGRRGVSLGTWLMLFITVLTVGMGTWVLPKLTGNLDEVSFDAGAIIQALAATAAPGTTPVPVYQESHDIISEPTATPAPSSRVLTIGAAGQIYVDSTLRRSGLLEGGSYNFDDVFTKVSKYTSAVDAMMVTLETTVTDGAPYDTYCAPSEILSSLKKAGVDIINIGSERILENGIEGLNKTRAITEMFGFSVTGAHRSQDEQALPLTFELNGIKVAILSYTYGLSTVGSKEGTRDQRAIAINLIDPDTIRRDVGIARGQGANLVIVNVHWGKRSNSKPSADCTKIVDQIADCGVDVILGTHPSSVHRMERRTVEWADGTSHEVFIAYSLGNFLTNERDSTEQIIGMILSMQFTLDPGSTTVRMSDVTWMPTWVMRWGNGPYHYQILPAGTSEQPADMNNTVFRNMRRAYEDVIKRLGDGTARSIAE